jgi:uncharacterized protein with ParB-like and HNH nuclease domain
MAEEVTIRSVITPNDQFLRNVFSNPKPYFIDIYQREYKWTKENVETLLKDIEVRFEQHQRTKEAPREIQSDVQERFEPYFLNTYLTHSMAANISVVDGQQRLTTFLLILIKLHQILKTIEADRTYEGKTFSSATLEKLIFETDDFGEASRFKIYNENRESTFRKLVTEQSITPQDETQQRIKENFEIINTYYDSFLQKKDAPGRYDLTKLTYYITYILDRISIVEIKIERQQNVATIFEVVNDRGLGLRPYEILKGKLIGNLPTTEKEHANEVWTKLQDNYFKAFLRNSTESKLDLDMFFRIFFRAKFADSENDYESFEGDYHYEMYRNPKVRNYFKDFRDPSLLYSRIINDIEYFSETYRWLRTTYENESLIYNKLLDQNQQYLLILSCLKSEDQDRDKKISSIARKFDQFHTVIRLLDAYESNTFQRLIYPICKDIREKPLAEASAVFDQALISYLENAEVLPKDEVKSVADIFTRERFIVAQNRWPNFSKYVLMRIDRYLSKLLDKPSYAGGDLQDLEEHFNKTTRRVHGMHLEHIYAYNEPNMALFRTKENAFDAQQFNLVRNLLGMVLLLKDSHNLSSGNEVYKDKIETYKKSNFIWNELLAGHLPGIDLRNLPDDLRVEKVEPDDAGAFPRGRIGERQKFMFNAIKHIWCDLGS